MSDINQRWIELARTVVAAEMDVFWEEQYTWGHLNSRSHVPIDRNYRSDAIKARDTAWDALKAWETANPELTPEGGHQMITDQVAEEIDKLRKVNRLIKSGALG